MLRTISLVSLFPALLSALPIPHQYLHASSPLPQAPIYVNYQGSGATGSEYTSRIPTPYESAVEARRILQDERYAVLSTIFPADSKSTTEQEAKDDLHAYERRPGSVAGLPVGLPEYIADCENTGNPTFLAIGISTSAKNWAAGSNVSLAVTSHDSSGRDWSSQAAHPRYTLFGYIEELSAEEVKSQHVETCFLSKHKDATAWLPGNPIHESYWARMVVTEVYWIGGFGDRAYIGWITGNDWRAAGSDMLQSA